MEIHRSLDGVEVVEGATWPSRPMDSRWTQPMVQIRCLSTAPDRFIGSVTVAGQVLFETPAQDTIDRVEPVARDHFQKAMVQMLRNACQE